MSQLEYICYELAKRGFIEKGKKGWIYKETGNQGELFEKDTREDALGRVLKNS